tara:strand:+ start:2591 stop:3148 length:558 start_codon:yes stop_codon:yes gene_type:complete
MTSKKKLQNTINDYLLTAKLVLSGKNNLPLIPYDIQELIINQILPENNKTHYNIEINNEFYDEKEIINSVRNYLSTGEFENGDERKKVIIKLLDYLILNSKFVHNNYKFASATKKKLKEFKLECKKHEDTQINRELYNKIEEASQKIFGIRLKNYCIKSQCLNCQSSIKINYNLCHTHLNQKFSI